MRPGKDGAADNTQWIARQMSRDPKEEPMKKVELVVGGAGLGSPGAISAHRKAGGEGRIALLSNDTFESAATDPFRRELVASGRQP